jgi:hypothetical protein
VKERSPIAWDVARLLNAPWTAHVRDILALYADCDDWPTLGDHNARLSHLDLANADGVPLRFESTSRRRTRRKAPAVVDVQATYDGHVAYKGIVPTREQSVHDFFNVVSWAAFPKTKQRINALQVSALTRRIGANAARVPNARSREEDLLTMLDEGGLIRTSRSFILGHAIFEHLYTQRSDVRAFAVQLDAQSNERTDADSMVAEKLKDGIFALDPEGQKGVSVSATTLRC